MSRALLWRKPCSHELRTSSISGLCPGPAEAPDPPKDPVVNAMKETTHPVHIRRLPTHPHPFPHDDKTLTPRQANRPQGQKRIYQTFVFKQTQKSLKTARYNQSKVFIASPARAGRRRREGMGANPNTDFCSPLVLRGVHTRHSPDHQALGARRALPCPPSPPAARAWPTCRWRAGLRSSGCFPSSQTSDRFQNLRPNLATCD